MTELDNFFQKIAVFPMMPKVIQEVLTLLNNDNTPIYDIVNKISVDQILTAKVLRLSNSSYFGRSGSIHTVSDAIAVTGLIHLKTLVTASGITATFSNIKGIDLDDFWQHCLMTANLARQISKERQLNTEVGYIGGLMHNIGQLPIYMVHPKEAAEIEAASKHVSMQIRQSIERERLGVDHCMVGGELVKRWNFPENIQSIIYNYSNPLTKDACAYAPIVHFAAHIAYSLEADFTPQETAKKLNPEVLIAMEMTQDAVVEKIESYATLISEAKNTL